ncbi:acyl-CoA thioesterase [Bacillus safensis]|uniref:acyl-CoA thioesterase n=1 Tax=Bacillus TaxID=1386 RepID=UPI000877792E|nr:MULTISPECIES: acyl-CoA thioesterase [Bacillus]MCY7466008.1 acyl-CoA thioesterase [Bacillus safensis]MDH6561660.1 acyl-CoA thioester hydrolase [Bacillus sp. TBS-096]MDP4565343.1 acyl-CoA thioesterase [Bacillus safensis]MEC0922718.1 acyl-CoA thioesterase [Bacillus safensis]MEC0995799.1 acyl-CoA thioesterase [Bacillus safensis]
MKWVTSEIIVRYVECDSMGIVHHSHYLNWFEIGRIELAHVAGVDFQRLHQVLTLPVIDLECRYKQSAKFGDTILVETALELSNKPMLIFHYKVRRKRGKVLLVQGKTQHVFLDKDIGLLLKIPKDIDNKIKTFLRS